MTLGLNFDAILSAARAGAEWAWTRLYDEFSPLVLGYLRARGAAEPEDLTGEVFLQIVRDIETFSGDERSFRSWLLSVAHHRMIDAARYRARRPVEPVPHETLAGHAPAGDAETEAIEALASERVSAVIATLTPDQQDVLLLRILGDLTVEEVARVLAKRPGAVKQLQRRGLAQVKKKLENEGIFLGGGRN
ncbi:MAG: RNA polymerase sigma factor [Actinomycetota bacterium]